MKWEKYTRVLWVLAIVSFAVAVLEGYFYYGEYTLHPLFLLLLCLQNGVKAFLFMPEIGVKDLLASLESAPSIRLAVDYAYGLAVLVAPLCTATVVLSWFERGVHWFQSALPFRRKTPVLVFGYNENVQSLLRSEQKSPSDSNAKIHVVSDAISDEDELRMLRQGIIPHRVNLLASPLKDRERAFRQLRLEDAERVLLMEDSSTRNFSLYRLLAKDHSFGKHFYCLCEDEATRSIIEDAFDQTQTGGAAKAKAELTLFSVAELKADGIFTKSAGDSSPVAMPLHSENLKRDSSREDRLDVHLLIAGFGTVGQQVLLQALNLGVLDEKNRLFIDVVDMDMNRTQEYFTNRFRITVGTFDGDSIFRLGAPAVDGELCIRFHQVDVLGRGFAQLLEELNREMPLTYAAVCMGWADAGMHCMVELKKLAGSFPIALRMENDMQAANYLKENDNTYREVFPLGINDEVLRIQNICDDARAKQAKQYHRQYDNVRILPQGATLDSLPSINERWQALKMYQRRANFLLCRHQAVKKVMGGLSPEELERYFGVDGTILRREDGLYRRILSNRETADAIAAAPALRKLATTEHRRWCYVMAADGWCYGEKKDETLRQTPYLSGWEELCEKHPEAVVYDLIPYLLAPEAGA